jgi:hypothetical protein
MYFVARTCSNTTVVGNFMIRLSDLPFRQKLLLSFTIFAGLFFLIAIKTAIVNVDTLNTFLFLYGMMAPTLLLSLDTLIDLNRKDVFTIWCIIAAFFLVAYLLTEDNPLFTIRRSSQYRSTGINKFISDSWASSLKSLPVFLIFYFVVNRIVKKATGNFIVNTFRQSKWYNDAARRKIYWYDVLTTFTLLAIIIIVSLFKF